MSNSFILSIDQGTSSTKALIFDASGVAVARGVVALHTNYLDHGFVEQDAEAIWQNVLDAVEVCLFDFESRGGQRSLITSIGISNQRETFVVWDEKGKPLHSAIVWQCKRSVSICEALKQHGLNDLVQTKTGLLIDPYFSATKMIWLFQQNATVRNAVLEGRAHFGTVDTWLLYKMTGGRVYATDHTNASRTLLFNLERLQWDQDLLKAFGLEGLLLPKVSTSSAHYGNTTLNGLFTEAVSIDAMVGDSHAAAFGEGCFEAGTAKATMGTGCSILMNVGARPVASQNGMVSTICWSVPGRVEYALEGVIVSCGSTIEWLKNELKLFIDHKETESIATSVPNNGGVYLVPAFSGLGSPYWQMDRKASIVGLTFGTGMAHIVRAALESVAYQIHDVIKAMEKDASIVLQQLNTDGGLSSNGFVLQFLSDLLQREVVRMRMHDVSALGAAYLAGLQSGIFENIKALHSLTRERDGYVSQQDASVKTAYEGWLAAIG